MATELHVWLADKDGYLMQEHHAVGERVDDFATFKANAAKNGQTAIAFSEADLADVRSGKKPGASAGSSRPAEHPDVVAARAKQARFGELRTKGWSKLTDAEKTEARELDFELNGRTPSA